jgi:cobalt-zinc-cadmium efflux system outer membrane protein
MNMIYKMRGLFSFLLIISLGSSLQSQENILTIGMAVESAYERNAGLQQLYALLKQEEQNRRTETGISSPEISYMKEGISSSPDNLFGEQRIAVTQEIDFPLTTIYRLKSVSERIQALQYHITAAEREVKADVKSSMLYI